MNLNYKLTTLIFVLLPVLLHADTRTELSVDKIDKKLLLHANAVVRSVEMEMRIENKNKVYVKEHVLITVLNEAADKYGHITQEYSQLQKIEKLSAAIYDKDGNEIKKVKETDFRSRPVQLSQYVFDDDRIKTYEYQTRQYPYTIEYTVLYKQNHSFYIPDFTPTPGRDCPVEKAALTVSVAPGMELNFKAIGFDDPQRGADGAIKTYTWNMRDLPAQTREPLSYMINDGLPCVLMACKDFMLGDVSGSQDTWDHLGAFSYALNKDRDVLPPNIKQQVHTLTDGTTDKYEKIRSLYKYLQANTRYVAIEYGIGGWQTLDATFLAKNQYGDCKALSNYMMSLLHEAGIEAYTALINAGRDKERYEITEDFPCTQFNHVILCIPGVKDTMWLECTSSDLPANYLSDFTDDRPALLVMPSGSKLVHTPRYDSSANMTANHAYVSLLPEEHISIDLNTISKGIPAYDILRHTDNASAESIEQYINGKFHLSDYTVQEHHFDRKDEHANLVMKEQVKMNVNHMVSEVNNLCFVDIDIIPLHLPVYVPVDNRKTQFYIAQSMSVSDTFEISMPEHTAVEALPKAASSYYSFGRYSRTIEKKDNRLIVMRRYVQNAGIYKAEEYNSYIKWLEAIKNDAGQKIVLKKNG